MRRIVPFTTRLRGKYNLSTITVDCYSDTVTKPLREMRAFMRDVGWGRADGGGSELTEGDDRLCSRWGVSPVVQGAKGGGEEGR